MERHDENFFWINQSMVTVKWTGLKSTCTENEPQIKNKMYKY